MENSSVGCQYVFGVCCFFLNYDESSLIGSSISLSFYCLSFLSSYREIFINVTYVNLPRGDSSEEVMEYRLVEEDDGLSSFDNCFFIF